MKEFMKKLSCLAIAMLLLLSYVPTAKATGETSVSDTDDFGTYTLTASKPIHIKKATTYNITFDGYENELKEMGFKELELNGGYKLDGYNKYQDSGYTYQELTFTYYQNDALRFLGKGIYFYENNKTKGNFEIMIAGNDLTDSPNPSNINLYADNCVGTVNKKGKIKVTKKAFEENYADYYYLDIIHQYAVFAMQSIIDNEIKAKVIKKGYVPTYNLLYGYEPMDSKGNPFLKFALVNFSTGKCDKFKKLVLYRKKNKGKFKKVKTYKNKKIVTFKQKRGRGGKFKFKAVFYIDDRKVTLERGVDIRNPYK